MMSSKPFNAHLVLNGGLRLLYYVPVREGGDRGGISSLLSPAWTVDLRQDQFLQT